MHIGQKLTGHYWKATKKGDGSFLELEFTVLEGEYRGRKVWDRLCINHPKDITQKIARGNLSAICRAVGVMQPRDSVELHNLPLVIVVKCKRRDDSCDIDNVIKGFLEKSAKGEAKSASAVQPQQAPASDTTPPWKR